LLLHDSVVVPEPPEMLVGESAHNMFVEFVVTTIETVPENPFSGETVAVEFPGGGCGD
jgi:hypothetical protein